MWMSTAAVDVAVAADVAVVADVAPVAAAAAPFAAAAAPGIVASVVAKNQGATCQQDRPHRSTSYCSDCVEVGQKSYTTWSNHRCHP